MKNIKEKARNVAVFLWTNNAYNAVVLTDGEFWICTENLGGVDLYAENPVEAVRQYISNTGFNSFADMYAEFSQDIGGLSPTVGRNFSEEFPRNELEICGMIYE